MAFGDPVDITMFAQRKFVNSVIPSVKRQKFKEKWLKQLQMSARVWTGFVIDYVTLVLLMKLCGWKLPNWTLGWKLLTGVCVASDILLLLALAFQIAFRHRLCPRVLRSLDKTAELKCRFDIYVFEFAAFKILSFLHGLYILGQGLVVESENLTTHEDIARIFISVVAIIDIVLNSVEMFASGCFWCVCCIQSIEVSPEEEAIRRRASSYEMEMANAPRTEPNPSNNNNNTHRDEVQSVYITSGNPLSRE